MISLIGNELKKIFKRKTLYVLLIIVLAFCIFNAVMSKIFENINDTYSENEAKYYKENLEYAKESGDIEFERQCKSYLDAYEISKKYEKNSWQRYIIEYKLQPLIDNMLMTKEGKEYELAKNEYDKILSDIEKNDWKIFAQSELEDINKQIEETQNKDEILGLNDEKQVIEWRLEKDIPYGNSTLNKYLTSWLSAKVQIREFEKNKNASYQEKVNNQRNIETVNLCEYAINNKIDENITVSGNSELQYELPYNAKSLLLETVESFSFFIIIAVVIVAGTIVSEEFNKGTIKLLLVRPFTRTKILLSKFITCLITLLISIVAIIIIQIIVGGIVYGFSSYSLPTIVYNFSTNSVQTIGILQYLVLTAVCLLPKFILLFTLAFSIGTILTNSPMAIAIPLLGIIGEQIINQLAYTYEKARFLMYFVTPNWDLNIYTFGKLPELEPITLPFSIAICIIYFVIMMCMNIFVFKKRDIKNI